MNRYHLTTTQFTSELQWQIYYLKMLFTHPSTLIKNAETYSKRSTLIFFFNFQFVYFVINLLLQESFVQNLIPFIQKTDSLAVYFPSIELYFSNTIFYISFLSFSHFILIIGFLSLLSFMISKLEEKSFSTIYKTHILFYGVAPFILINTVSLICSSVILLTISLLIVKISKWNNASKLTEVISTTIIKVLVIVLTQLPVL